MFDLSLKWYTPTNLYERYYIYGTDETRDRKP